jgi:DNA polymerase-4
MDAFFAAVEVLDRPELAGKPVLVGHDGPRGVVAAASYEARKYGCHSAQPMAVAKRLCPHAIIVRGRHSRYREISEQVFAIFDAFAPVVQPLSIDEAFLDVTGTERLLGDPLSIASNVKKRIRDELGLNASVGVAGNKYLAKLASDLSKPNGLMEIPDHEINRILPPLPVGRIWGIGPKTVGRLAEIGVRTIADMRSKPADWFDRQFASDAQRVLDLCFGRDERPVTPDREARSIGQEQTFEIDVSDPEQVRHVLLGHVEEVARRLRKHNLGARGVGLKIRFGDFKTISRSVTLDEPTDATQLLWAAARVLFDRWAVESFQPVRLIGMHADRLGLAGEATTLFPDQRVERHRKLDRALDRINARFGKTTIRRAAAED